MPVTLLLPGALVPSEVARALAEPLAASVLASVLARGQLIGDSEMEAPAHLGWLGEQLFRQDPPLATAPYAYAALAGDKPAADTVLWHADPVHLELARDHLVLMPLPAALPDDEAAALIAAANALAADEGLEFVRVAGRWFLRASRAWDVDAAPLAAALGRPVHAVLPAGGDAARWTRLLTEIQMTWHGHAVNEAREARGEPAVNSVWLHGGGRWTALPPARHAAVLADEPEWRGAAHAAGARAADIHATVADGALVVLSRLLSPRLLHDWGAWTGALGELDARVAALARAHDIDFVLTGDAAIRRVRSRPSDRLKFWRAGSPAQVLSE